MRQKTGLLETAMALAVALVVLFSLGYVYLKGFSQQRQGQAFYAEFDAVGGLSVGAPVKINGATVGQVHSVEINPQKSYTVMVKFSLRKDLPIPEDSSMAIVSETLLGQPALTLTPGMQTKLLAAGSTIYNTTPPVGLMDLVERSFFGSKTDEAKTDDAGARDEGREDGRHEKDESSPSSDAGMSLVPST
jgi:phospholipid/cholesterol/gamma-HCH transport system substrate-binding protein